MTSTRSLSAALLAPLLLLAACDSDKPPKPEPVPPRTADKPAAPEPDEDASPTPTEGTPIDALVRRHSLILGGDVDLKAALKAIGGVDGVTVKGPALESGLTFQEEGTCERVDIFDNQSQELLGEHVLLMARATYTRCVHPRPRLTANSERATLTYAIPDEVRCTDDRGPLAEVSFKSLRRDRLQPPRFANAVHVHGRAGKPARSYQVRAMEVRWIGEDHDGDGVLHDSYMKYLKKKYRRINLRRVDAVCKTPVWRDTQTVGAVETPSGPAPLTVSIYAHNEGNAMAPLLYELAFEVAVEDHSCEGFAAPAAAEKKTFEAMVGAVGEVEVKEGMVAQALAEACSAPPRE